jgi:hypothetical protein
MAQAEKTARKAALAERLINGLSGENKRWSETITKLEVTEVKLVGDVLLASSFVSYAGPFNMQFRQQLVNEKWMPDLVERAIPMTHGALRPVESSRGCPGFPWIAWALAGLQGAGRHRLVQRGTDCNLLTEVRGCRRCAQASSLWTC